MFELQRMPRAEKLWSTGAEMYKQFRLNEFESGREINKTFRISSARGGSILYLSLQ